VKPFIVGAQWRNYGDGGDWGVRTTPLWQI